MNRASDEFKPIASARAWKVAMTTLIFGALAAGILAAGLAAAFVPG